MMMIRLALGAFAIWKTESILSEAGIPILLEMRETSQKQQ
jgi:hypothetical protein